MNFDFLKSVSQKYGCELIENAPMSEYVTMRAGGIAAWLIKPNSSECIRETVCSCKENGVPYVVLGNGSNVIVCDEGLSSVVINISNQFGKIEVEDNIIKCQAGAPLSKVCQAALNNGLSGLEFAWGIPGTVGGALYMNAGAYGGEMKDIVVSCEYLDSDGEIKTIYAQDMDLSYRHSVFTDSSKVILTVTMELKIQEKEAIKALMDKNILARKTKQPLEYPSSGSTFKRPEGSYASLLIEQCGLKGLAVGGAQVSTKHSGFVINTGGATCSDIEKLIEKIKDIVEEKTGFKLECEVKFFRD